MSIRRQPLVIGEMYHIYNRGVDKRDIFTDKNDIYRFIESIKEFNRVEKIESLANLRKSKFEHSSQIGLKGLSGGGRIIEVIGYCLNPNHFHFIIRQTVDNGITKFMQKLQAGYTNYFNIKNSRSGSLLQGTFKSQIITDQNYFNKLIGYVNKNYLIHNIPESKNELVFSGDYEYENNKFNIISKKEGENILEVFGGVKKFKKHCDEIVSIVREERGKKSLLEDENLHVIIESLPDRP
jgi:putative transposase